MKQNKKIIGLIGGMGPYASAYFYKLLLDKSNHQFGAAHNDEFPEVLLDSVPVPDFISDTSKMEEAKEILVSRVKKMNDFGCTNLAMVCNTGHLLYPQLSAISDNHFTSLITVVSEKVRKLQISRVGLFATRVTIEHELYQKELSDNGVQVFIPDSEMINFHEKIIRNVIAEGESEDTQQELVERTKKFIADNKLEGIILGCTELPLIFPKRKFAKVVDCLDVLAEALLSEYYAPNS